MRKRKARLAEDRCATKRRHRPQFSELTVPWGQTKEGKWLSPAMCVRLCKSERPSLVCVECKTSLVLKAGEKNRVHFAHAKSNSQCRLTQGTGERQQHYLAKSIVHHFLSKCRFMENCVSCSIHIREYAYVKHEAKMEFTIDKYRIDVAGLNIENGQPEVGIEVCQTHALSAEKRNALERDLHLRVHEVAASDVIQSFELYEEKNESVSVLPVIPILCKDHAFCECCFEKALFRKQEELRRKAEETKKKEEKDRIREQEELKRKAEEAKKKKELDAIKLQLKEQGLVMEHACPECSVRFEIDKFFPKADELQFDGACSFSHYILKSENDKTKEITVQFERCDGKIGVSHSGASIINGRIQLQKRCVNCIEKEKQNKNKRRAEQEQAQKQLEEDEHKRCVEQEREQKQLEAEEKRTAQLRIEHPEQFITFGKHIGMHRDEIPNSYLDWLTGWTVTTNNGKPMRAESSQENWKWIKRNHPEWVKYARREVKMSCIQCWESTRHPINSDWAFMCKSCWREAQC